MTFAVQARRRHASVEEALYEVHAETADGGEIHTYLVVAASERDAEASLPVTLHVRETRCCGSAPLGAYGVVGRIVQPANAAGLAEPRGRPDHLAGRAEPIFGLSTGTSQRRH